ncbi:MAG: hypothetical protein IK133_03705 [Clostridia bacterium]|nr:hypothetical protein [Clostridia bacterium]MBR5382905.1 hypothetical protein [Clostridia bacterium]
MKKLVCLLLIIILVFTAQLTLAEDAIVSMTDTAIRMTADLSACTASELYVRYFSVSDEIAPQIVEIGEKLSGSPQSAWLIQLDTELLLSVMAGELTDLPELAYSNLLRRVPLAMVQQFNAKRSSEFIAACSVLSLGDVFAAAEGMPESVILILDYGTDVASACRFTSEFGCASCTVQPIAWDENTQSTLSFLSQMGALTMEPLAL